MSRRVERGGDTVPSPGNLSRRQPPRSWGSAGWEAFGWGTRCLQVAPDVPPHSPPESPEGLQTSGGNSRLPNARGPKRPLFLKEKRPLSFLSSYLRQDFYVILTPIILNLKTCHSQLLFWQW
jgi:hypothetical protein